MYQNVQLCELTTHERGQDESDFCDFEALGAHHYGAPRPGRPRTVFGTIRSFSSSVFCLIQLIYMNISYTLHIRTGGASVHRTEPPRVFLGLRWSAQTLRREPRNRLISVFLTTNSFFCSVFFIRQLVHIMQIGFPPKNSFWRAVELLYGRSVQFQTEITQCDLLQLRGREMKILFPDDSAVHGRITWSQTN